MDSFGPLLKRWRQHRRMSQQALSDCAEVSTRHISFLENGRAAPSRQMVLLLTSALDLPLRERNTLLAAAGFTPAYSARKLSDPQMAPVRQAVDFLFKRWEPNPAIAVDRAWNLYAMNEGARRLSETFLTPDPELLAVANNALHLLFHPCGLRPHVVNWEEVASLTLHRLQREALQDQCSAELLAALMAYPDTPTPSAPSTGGVLIPVHLRRGDVELRLATLLATIGAPIDATARELTVEIYYPLDAATERWLNDPESS